MIAKRKFRLLASAAVLMALKQQLEDDQINGLTTANTTAAVDDDTRFLFRAFGKAKEYMSAHAHWIAGNLPERRIVSLNLDDATDRDQIKVTPPASEAAGLEALAVRSCGTGSSKPMTARQNGRFREAAGW